jgi:quercetin dioxygenase-like cupin family protein
MKIIRERDGVSEQADPANFVGRASVRRLGDLDAAGTARGFLVSFEPGGRTNWHRHTGTQLLLIVEGRGRVQSEGEPVREVAAGDAVSIAPGEKHWHGASPEAAMTHVAINLDATTEWLERVSEETYRGLE